MRTATCGGDLPTHDLQNSIPVLLFLLLLLLLSSGARTTVHYMRVLQVIPFARCSSSDISHESCVEARSLLTCGHVHLRHVIPGSAAVIVHYTFIAKIAMKRELHVRHSTVMLVTCDHAMFTVRSCRG